MKYLTPFLFFLIALCCIGIIRLNYRTSKIEAEVVGLKQILMEYK